MSQEFLPPRNKYTGSFTEDTLGLQRREYWEELNPILKRWKSVNKSSCPDCQKFIQINMGRHIRLIWRPMSGRELLVVVHGGVERQRSYRSHPQVQGGRGNVILWMPPAPWDRVVWQPEIFRPAEGDQPGHLDGHGGLDKNSGILMWLRTARSALPWGDFSRRRSTACRWCSTAPSSHRSSLSHYSYRCGRR